MIKFTRDQSSLSWLLIFPPSQLASFLHDTAHADHYRLDDVDLRWYYPFSVVCCLLLTSVYLRFLLWLQVCPPKKKFRCFTLPSLSSPKYIPLVSILIDQNVPNSKQYDKVRVKAMFWTFLRKIANAPLAPSMHQVQVQKKNYARRLYGKRYRVDDTVFSHLVISLLIHHRNRTTPSAELANYQNFLFVFFSAVYSYSASWWVEFENCELLIRARSRRNRDIDGSE